MSVVGRVARKLVTLALAVTPLCLAACAEAPAPPSGSPAQGFSPAAARAARLDLTAINGGASSSSPYPLSQLAARLTTADGHVYATPIFTPQGPETGGLAPLNPADLSWNVPFGQFTSDLVYVPPFDLLPVIGGDLTVTVWVTKQPSVHAQLVLRPRFDGSQYLNLSGRNGSLGSFSSPGTEGEPGPLVRVAIGYLDGPTKTRLVLVRVDDARGLRARTVVAPGGPPLQIFLDGGSGGMGGPGIERGYGVYARTTPSGIGGNGGDGGGAEIEYDEDSPELEKMVVVFNRGGGGGVGGGGAGQPGRQGSIPRTHAAPVRQLFHDELAHGVPVHVHGALEPAKNESI